ncbi:MAG: site-specific DNA-methyltransferase [Nitrospirae bacterium]|nr:site-specific DNA-methyltransferase [Nitrospirota bacterium]MCL5422764.1 site-specific DNA-methyltransferase [Nitrospirota bacterium]
MPTLQFKGKNIIWNHHLSIPYHTLDEVSKLNFRADKGDGNLIIEGDNLLALKALLPQYAGKIKCIYIDPPYNTGNEGWIYNDKVNSPLIKEWLGKEVGKDDLTRHDKWLCMMLPRLKLLRDLLADDGVIFASIDDFEVYNLRMLLNEVFGEENFVAEIIIHSNPKGRVLDRHFSKSHEYVIAFAKDVFQTDLSLEKSEEDIEVQYPEEDKHGKFRQLELRNTHREFGKHNRPNLYFPFYVHPEKLTVSLEAFPKAVRVYPDWDDGYEGCWTWGESKSREKLKLIIAKRIGNRIKIFRKAYSHDESGAVARKKLKTIWYDNIFNTEKGQQEVDELLGKRAFPQPKPLELIKNCIRVASDADSIILDSFAGSGTTMHAAFDLNKEDGGNRQCILVQMTEATEKESKKNICRDATRARNKRAIEKYGYKSGFKYLRVGDPIDAETLLSGTLPTYRQFAKYVFHLCTGEYLQDESSIDEKSYFVGMHKKKAIYLIYKKDYDTLTRLALNLPLAESILKDQKNRKVIVYAPACFLDEEYLEAKNIEFVGIPYNLFRRNRQ